MSRTFNTDPHYVKLLRAAKAGYNSRKKMHNLYPINTSTTPSWTITSYEPLLVVNIPRMTDVLGWISELIAITREMTNPVRVLFVPIINKHSRDTNELYAKFSKSLKESPILKQTTVYQYNTDAFYIDVSSYNQFDDDTLAKIAVNNIANAIQDSNYGVHPNNPRFRTAFEVYLQIPKDCYKQSQISDLPFDKNCVGLKRHKFKPGYSKQIIIDTRNELEVPVEINIPYKETSTEKDRYRCRYDWCHGKHQKRNALKHQGLPDDAELMRIKKEYNSYH